MAIQHQYEPGDNLNAQESAMRQLRKLADFYATHGMQSKSDEITSAIESLKYKYGVSDVDSRNQQTKRELQSKIRRIDGLQ